MRSDLLCRVWIGESWPRSLFVCIKITLLPHFPCTLWKVMLAQNVRFFASKSLLQIQLVESESDIDTKSLQSFLIKIIPPPPSPCPPHPPCSPGIWCFVIYPTMHCNVSWLTIREVSVKKIICSRDCVVTQKWKWYWSHFSLVSKEKWTSWCYLLKGVSRAKNSAHRVLQPLSHVICLLPVQGDES